MIFKLLCSAMLLLFATGCMKESSRLSSASEEPLKQLSISEVHEHVVYRDAETNAPISNPNAAVFNEKFTYLVGQPKTWPTGVIKWHYNPAGQPSIFTADQVISAIKEATERWTAVCGVRFEYQGLTTAVPQFSSCDDISSVGWGPLQDNIMGYAMACYRGSNFDQLDVMFDNIEPLQIHNLDWLKITAAHEFGHILGLGHTDINNAVMYGFLNQRFPIADDIEGCQSLYGAAGNVSQPAPIPTPAPQTPAPVCTAGSTQTCSVVNGVGQRTCNAAGSGYGSCQVVSCNSGYTNQNGSCVVVIQPPIQQPTTFCSPNTTRSCSARNGIGIQTCNARGSRYSSCEIQSCNEGYSLNFWGTCRRNR